MTRIDDEMVMAYADGELDPARRAEVEAAILADPAVAAAVERQRRLRAAVSGAYSDLAREPVPDALLAAVRGGTQPAEVVDLAAVRARRSQPPEAPPRPGWRAGAAIAATLLVGIIAGRMADLGPTPLVGTENGTLVAQGALAHALDEQLASEPAGGSVRVGLTFRDEGGRYCRTFTEARGLSGIACREDGGWGVRMAMASGATQDGEYRMASSETPPGVLAAVGEMIAGDALDASQERAARESGWE